MRGIVLVMVVLGLQVRYLLVIVPVCSLTLLISYSRYILNAGDVVVILIWVQTVVVYLIFLFL